MPAASHITLDMCIEEMKKQHIEISKGSSNPYLKASRLAVVEKLLQLLKEAKANKNTSQPNFVQLINKMP